VLKGNLEACPLLERKVLRLLQWIVTVSTAKTARGRRFGIGTKLRKERGLPRSGGSGMAVREREAAEKACGSQKTS
jgi:hypothetical protein